MNRNKFCGRLIVKIIFGFMIVLILSSFIYVINDNIAQQNETQEIVIDIDGNVYKTVKIGKQIWMAENLKVTRYRDGTPMPVISNYDEKWSDLTTGAFCWYDDNQIKYKDIYGALYNFYAVEDSKKISPEGWHVPTTAEWKELIEYLGGEETAGGKMKLQIPDLWLNNSKDATNESGFSGVPAGGRGRLGTAGEGGNFATWWSSTSYDSLFAWHWGLYPNRSGIRFNPGHKTSGFSVRCIKD